MRNNPSFALNDDEEIRRLIRENPWVTLINHTSQGLVASHYPVVLDDSADGIAVLGHLVDHFEDRMPESCRMAATLEDAQYATRISAGTVGFRLTATRITAKSNLSQNKPAETVERIIRELQSGENYSNPDLAEEMRRVHGSVM